MLPIFLQLKTIYSSLTRVLRAPFLSGVLFLTAAHSAFAFEWPFSTEEFQKKLSAKDMTPSTRYFARGPTFLSGQKWNENEFSEQLKEQNYRIREPGQTLMTGDAQKLSANQCKTLIRDDSLPESSFCWRWQTRESETYLAVINGVSVLSTWAGETPAPYWKASLDPVLIAQYKGQLPIMQNELKISDFPVNCLNAVMAIEDSEFLEHSGLSYLGLTRSLIKNISKMRYAQGGSTITQQLVKNYFLTPEKTIKRKLMELYLAIKLESEWTKDEILETYLNIIYMGQSGAFQVLGFGAASQYYFAKPVSQLNLPQCSLLAAIVNNPGLFNPWKKPDRARQRRDLVLKKMQELKLITEGEYAAAVQEPLPKEVSTKATETAPYFFEAVRSQIQELKLPDFSGDVFTSLDIETQQQAQTSLQKHISNLESSRKNLMKNREKGRRLEGLVMVSENQTALVNALVGGQNYRQTQFNRALNGKRQIGSLIKPFVYLTALMDGADPLTEVEDSKFEWKYDKKSWTPENYEHTYAGKMPLYFALKESLNVPTARLAQKTGLDKIISTARSAGFISPMDPTPATSLGASVHSPIEVLNAYRSLANLGQFSQSRFIEKIKTREGETLFEYKPVFEPHLEPASVSVLVGMLKETLRSGTAKASQALGWKGSAAGKTGTTSDNKDAWFAGFTPAETAVVWLGYDQSLSSQLTGGSGAVPVWVDIMLKQNQKWPDTDFRFTEDVEKRQISLHGTDRTTELIFKK